MKTKKFLIGIILSFSFAMFVNDNVANASRWHKGVPSSIRGFYKRKGPDVLHPVQELTIKNHKIEHFISMMVMSGHKNIGYKYLGNHKYAIKFNLEAAGGYLPKKNCKIYVTKVGKNVKYGNQIYYRH